MYHFVCDHKQGRGEDRIASSIAHVLGGWRHIRLSLGRRLCQRKEDRNQSQATLGAPPNTNSPELHDPGQVMVPLRASTFSSAKWGHHFSPAECSVDKKPGETFNVLLTSLQPQASFQFSRICELRSREASILVDKILPP